jgi:hypothetical protein
MPGQLLPLGPNYIVLYIIVPYRIVLYRLSETGDDIHEGATFSDNQLRKALERKIGRSLIEAVLHDMQVLYGLSFEHGTEGSVCTLAEFRRALEDMLGVEASNLMMKKIKKELLSELRANTLTDDN